MSQKKDPPKTFCGIFSPGEPVKLPWLLPQHIPMSTPILVHLSEYLCEIDHFYRCDPQILRIQFSLSRNSRIFRKNRSHIK